MTYKKRFSNLSGSMSPISGANNNQGAWNNNNGTEIGRAHV